MRTALRIAPILQAIALAFSSAAAFSYEPKNRSCLYVRCIKSDSVRVASQLKPVT
jgi:hypothetical protein